jgi:dTDP-4-dehydrorhamnose 3,5-epimerase
LDGTVADLRPSPTIDAVVIAEPEVHADQRGVFVETWRRQWVPGSREMVQANRADRQAGSLVGLHYHLHQADFWYVTAGRARVVLHDLRVGSPTDGATESFHLGGDGAARHRGVYIPPGVAHGFAALTDLTITYLVDRHYDPDDELGLAWDDREVGAAWGLTDPVLSDRDQANPLRSEIPDRLRPLHPGES